MVNWNWSDKSWQECTLLEISELNGCERVNLIQMTIISTTVGKNPLEEME